LYLISSEISFQFFGYLSLFSGFIGMSLKC
jgi:hypothetical protein